MTRIEHAAAEYVLYLKRGMTHAEAIVHPVRYVEIHAPKKWTREAAATEIVRLAKLDGFVAHH